MPVVVLILNNRSAILRDTRRHKLPDDATEVRGHQHCLQTFYFPRVKLKVDKAEEVYKVVHCGMNVRSPQAVRKFCSAIEAVRV
jgi:hypothetical protein